MDKRPAGVTGLYNAEFMDHVQYPDYKYRMENATHTHEGVNPSCGDELTFYLRMADAQPAGATTSMQRDIASGLPSELDAQLGALCRAGDEAGVPTPVLDLALSVLAPREAAARAGA